MKKKCTKCNKEKDSKFFAKDKRASSGLQSACKQCQSKYSKNKYKDPEYKKNVLQRGKKYKDAHKKELSKKRKIYYDNNRDKELKTRKKHYKKNKVEINKKANNYRKEKRKKDFIFKLKGDVRSLIGNSFRKNGFNKNTKTETILGCSFLELKNHIEKQFESWMNWENRGLFNGQTNYGWDIDHIIPLASAKTKEDVIKLNHYTNLRPLCSVQNRTLNNRRNFF